MIPATPSAPAHLEHGEPAGRFMKVRSWLLEQLDSLISEPLRASASEFSRARVLAGIACTMLLFTLLFHLSLLMAPQSWLRGAPVAGVELGLLGSLVVLRRSASISPPAMVFCTTAVLGPTALVFVFRDPYMNTHIANALASAFAVYLLGPRKGLLITALTLVLMALSVGILHGLMALSAPPTSQYLWPMNVAADLGVLALWVLGALHSTARDAAQGALERTLKTLHDSERKLSSLFENTDDMVCSLDTEGRLLVANTALRQAYTRRFGQPPVVGERLFPDSDFPNRELWAQQLRKALNGQRAKFEQEYAIGSARMVLEVSVGPITGEDGRPVGVALFARDITSRKEAEARLGEMHRTLVDVSRQAGMAEVATGVLHNVGNTLNSVNISANLLTEGLRRLRVPNLARAVALLKEHAAELGAFLTTHPQGQQLPDYLQALCQQMGEQQEELMNELRSLNESVEHVKNIVSMQQKHARSVGAVEPIPVPQLIDEALRLHAVSFERLGITLERDYAALPPLVVDRHKLLQILMNLLSNAQHALMESPRQDKRLTIRVHSSPDGQHLLIEVADNGVGIAPEHLPRLFSQGFTTKREGHGFGLHISALSSMEMRGRLRCTRSEPGQGATFTLELPWTGEPGAPGAPENTKGADPK